MRVTRIIQIFDLLSVSNYKNREIKVIDWKRFRRKQMSILYHIRMDKEGEEKEVSMQNHFRDLLRVIDILLIELLECYRSFFQDTMINFRINKVQLYTNNVLYYLNAQTELISFYS